jgi:hypothetical protein
LVDQIKRFLPVTCRSKKPVYIRLDKMGEYSSIGGYLQRVNAIRSDAGWTRRFVNILARYLEEIEEVEEGGGEQAVGKRSRNRREAKNALSLLKDVFSESQKLFQTREPRLKPCGRKEGEKTQGSHGRDRISRS